LENGKLNGSKHIGEAGVTGHSTPPKDYRPTPGYKPAYAKIKG